MDHIIVEDRVQARTLIRAGTSLAPFHTSALYLRFMAKTKTISWPLALRLRIAFGGERPAPESKDHVTY